MRRRNHSDELDPDGNRRFDPRADFVRAETYGRNGVRSGGESSAIRQYLNSWQVDQVFIRGHERQSENLCRSCKKVVGGITVWKVYGPNGKCHFDGERRFGELQVLHGVGNPRGYVVR